MPTLPTREALLRRRLPARFYRRPHAVVARALLGCAVVCGDRAAMIVETEAYLGAEDAASHARFGRTRRTAPMFEAGGVAYVYLCYGIHEMFNVVTGGDGDAGAVLIRGAAPLRGLAPDAAIARGPGRLTRALGIGRRHDGASLVDAGELFVARWRRLPEASVTVGPRIGVAYAGAWGAAPLRFTVAGHPAVSRGPRLAGEAPWRG